MESKESPEVTDGGRMLPVPPAGRENSGIEQTERL